MASLDKVYLFTYKRHGLLPRALNSLLNQTFKDWSCELHNDCPGDKFPEQLVNQACDSRVTIVNHETNLGATASFNLAFHPVPEKYVTLLEDDNWWEPNFLAEMVKAMESNPGVSVSWSNMKCWKEDSLGQWTDTGTTINPNIIEPTITYPHLVERQMHGAVHSNGAMLVRTTNIGHYTIPPTTWFDFVESVRERVFDYPIMFVNQVLANFSLTIQTSRTKDLSAWNAWQIMLCGSYISSSRWERDKIRSFWLQEGKVKYSHHYVLAACFYPGVRRVIRYAPLKAWIFCVLYYGKHFRLLLRTIKKVRHNPALKDFIDQNTRLNLNKSYG